MTDVLAGGLGESFAQTVLNGPLLLAVLVAALAGMVSFVSPCVLPLVPGYIGYVSRSVRDIARGPEDVPAS